MIQKIIDTWETIKPVILLPTFLIISVVVLLALLIEVVLCCNIGNQELLIFSGENVGVLLTILAAILIPIIIALINEKDAFSIDRALIFREIIMKNNVIYWIIGTAVLLVIDTTFVRIMAILSAIVSTLLTIHVIYLALHWLYGREEKSGNTYQQRLRLKYLYGLQRYVEIYEAWFGIIEDKDISQKNQFGLIDSYLQKYKDMILPKQKDKISQSQKQQYLYLLGKADNFNNIAYYDLDTFSKIVTFSVGYYIEKQRAKEIIDHPPYSQKMIFVNAMKAALSHNKDNSCIDYIFFSEVNKYVTKELTSIKNRTFFDRSFLEDLLPELESQKEKYSLIRDLWENDYIDSLVVTSEGLRSDTDRPRMNNISVVVINYLNSRLDEKGLKPNDIIFMDDIIKEVFPRVDVLLFGNILYINHWSYNFQVDDINILKESVIQSVFGPKNCGLSGRIVTFTLDSNLSEQDKEKESQRLLAKISQDEAKETMDIISSIIPQVKDVKIISILKKVVKLAMKEVGSKHSTDNKKNEIVRLRLERYYSTLQKIDKYNKSL